MAGAPEGHRTDEAGQIPQAPAQAPQAPEQNPAEPGPAGGQAEQPTERTPQAPGFGERGRMRRRARFLRRARELAYRDLGGLVFDLHRFGQRNDQVVLAKLATLGHIDAELRTLEEALRDLRPVTVLREAGIAACPRCAAIHGSDDKFCPGCGLAFDRSADRPLSTAPVTGTPGTAPAPAAAGTLGTTAAQSDLSIGRPAPATPAEPAPPVKPTAAPVPARPAFPGVSQPNSTPQVEPSQGPSGDGGQDKLSQPSPSQAELSPSNGEKKPEPEDEPTQILRPPARGA
ncbi:MAG TPA: hypothetical protein VGI26_10865 [Solirubrobacteraceae bacterium]